MPRPPRPLTLAFLFATAAAVAAKPDPEEGAQRGHAGPHSCPKGCDSCADYDCSNRGPGVIPACSCLCHVECFARQNP